MTDRRRANRNMYIILLFFLSLPEMENERNTTGENLCCQVRGESRIFISGGGGGGGAKRLCAHSYII